MNVKGRVNWARYFDPAELRALAEAFRMGSIAASQRERARERILFLWNRRSDDGAHYRSRVNVASRYLHLSIFFLAGLVVPFAISLWIAGSHPAVTLVSTGLAGALGGTLAGARILRSSTTMNDLRGMRNWMFVQPWVGAAAALAILAVLASGIVKLPGAQSGLQSWAGLAAYGFVAGFSEPFFLGVVARIAGVHDSEASTRPGDDRDD